MAEVVAIGNLAQIPAGEGRNFLVDGTRIAVFHTREGQVFATQADCPHRGGPLADGLTDSATVVCPLHDRVYDFHTGAGIGHDCAIAVYPTELAPDGTIRVGTIRVGTISAGMAPVAAPG